MNYDIHNTQYIAVRRCFLKYVILNRHQHKCLPVNNAIFLRTVFLCVHHKNSMKQNQHTKQLFSRLDSLRHQIITCLHIENQFYFS